MKESDILYLKELCTQFRNAISAYRREDLPIGFHEFPRASCGDASLILGKYLHEMGLGEFEYVRGESGRHAWLERDGIIVDITANQFDEIEEEVMITNNTEFHKRFNEENREPYTSKFGNEDYVDEELLPAYKRIISFLDEKYKPRLKNDKVVETTQN